MYMQATEMPADETMYFDGKAGELAFCQFLGVPIRAPRWKSPQRRGGCAHAVAMLNSKRAKICFRKMCAVHPRKKILSLGFFGGFQGFYAGFALLEEEEEEEERLYLHLETRERVQTNWRRREEEELYLRLETRKREMENKQFGRRGGARRASGPKRASGERRGVAGAWGYGSE
jgi:hypothetical protein